ncbi:MAG: response regulator [Bacteroidales bacterium]|nr:response regulator [Bacteroidales bacterium]
MKSQNSKTKKRILLAEGFKPSEKVMTEILKMLGWEYDTANNGYDVILALKNKSFDLLLLDLELPQLDGFETIEHIRKKLEYPINTIPVMAMINRDFSSDFNQTYKDEGFDEIIVKPFSIDELDEKIKELFYRKNPLFA